MSFVLTRQQIQMLFTTSLKKASPTSFQDLLLSGSEIIATDGIQVVAVHLNTDEPIKPTMMSGLALRRVVNIYKPQALTINIGREVAEAEFEKDGAGQIVPIPIAENRRWLEFSQDVFSTEPVGTVNTEVLYGGTKWLTSSYLARHEGLVKVVLGPELAAIQFCEGRKRAACTNLIHISNRCSDINGSIWLDPRRFKTLVTAPFVRQSSLDMELGIGPNKLSLKSHALKIVLGATRRRD